LHPGDQKVSAAAKAQQYKAYVSTELQDVATVEQNVVALYETRRVTTTIKTSVTPSANKKDLNSPKSKKRKSSSR
jgi:hypothetical protein